jgi:hypothetical protein
MRQGMNLQNKLLLSLLLWLVGCAAPVIATPTAPPLAPTRAPTSQQVTPTPTVTATAVLSVNDAALRVFPLKRGAQWIYTETAYDTLPNDLLPQRTNRQITATLQITDTVMDTQTYASYYAAQVVRERTIISTTMDLAQLGEYREMYFANNAPATKWYIFAGDQVYSQFENLDWTAAQTSTLEYQLPLTEGTRWYPDPEQRAQFSVDDALPGLRVVEAAPQVRVPGGEFANCFVLHDFYNTGAVLTDFCPGVGIVGEQFDHAGTPFGSHTELLKFTPGQ